MLDLKFVRENPELVKDGLTRRSMDTAVVDDLIALDDERRALILDVESKKAERNAVSKEIGRSKDQSEREAKIASMRTLGDSITELDARLKIVEENLFGTLSAVPNIPDADVPMGKDDKDNVVVRTVGEKKEFDFEPKAHWDLGPALGILDFDAGVKLSGSRFYVLEGGGARLQRALIRPCSKRLRLVPSKSRLRLRAWLPCTPTRWLRFITPGPLNPSAITIRFPSELPSSSSPA
jgi:seryl-tRNA synthetase